MNILERKYNKEIIRVKNINTIEYREIGSKQSFDIKSTVSLYTIGTEGSWKCTSVEENNEQIHISDVIKEQISEIIHLYKSSNIYPQIQQYIVYKSFKYEDNILNNSKTSTTFVKLHEIAIKVVCDDFNEVFRYCTDELRNLVNGIREYKDYLNKIVKYINLTEIEITNPSLKTILAPNVAALFIHECIGHLSEADLHIGNKKVSDIYTNKQKVSIDGVSPT